MAFHVACPITCRRICYCSLGFPRDLHSAKSKADFALHVSRIEDFLSDPLGIRASRDGSATVQVLVPRVEPAAAPPPPPPPQKSQPQAQPQPQLQQLPVVPAVDGGAAGGADVADETKRVAIQKKAVVPEDFARRIQPADTAVVLKDGSGDEQAASDADALCRLCFVDETEGSERAQRMLSCNTCSKKYHRSCLKGWSKHRDLFHWSSWTCPYCRICEICRRTGDPSKFMFCKRCDDAYHCHCQHPPHKNVGSGPYLCPKHTRCHSCGSSVPGNGLSVRWFLGYTCCDACGRLFVKGNYCPVCLKVYRDSESTPMVCCDICQRWVHCSCDGISDEKYHQFQLDGNLQYKCATCRGECYQVKDLEDAVRELWRRRDIADHELIASLRAAAGLPTQEDIFSIPSYSDDEETGPVVHKNESGRPLKVSLKGLADKSPNKSKEHGKKTSNKKAAKKIGSHASLISKTEPLQNDIQYYGHSVKDNKNDSMQSHGKAGPGMYSSSVAGTMNQPEGVRSTNQTGGLKHKLVNEVMVSDGERTSRVVKIKSNKAHDLDSGDQNENDAYKLKSVKAKKLVINLGPRKINVTNSPKSDASSCQKEQDLMSSNGDTADHSSQLRGLKYARRDGNLKFGRVKSEESNLNPKFDKRGVDGYETVSADQDRVSAGKRTGDGSKATVATVGEMPILRSDKSLGKQSAGRPDAYTESNDDSDSLPKDSKFSLKLKIKKPNLERQNPQTPLYEEEKSFIRGLRSKRKRSSTLMEKSSLKEDEVTESHQDTEMMEASWILKKLGKDAIGKRVEVHQSSNNSWHKGVVSDITEGTSMLSVSLDDGRVKTLELGKQAVRFVSQKQKRSRT